MFLFFHFFFYFYFFINDRKEMFLKLCFASMPTTDLRLVTFL